MRKFFVFLFIFSLFFLFGVCAEVDAWNYCLTPNSWFSSVEPNNVLVDQKFSGEMIIEIVCLGEESSPEICSAIPMVNYGSGDERIGDPCVCESRSSPPKTVRCSYNFTNSFDSSGEKTLIPRFEFRPSGSYFSGPSMTINVFERPTFPPGTGAGNPLSTSTIPGLIKTATNVIYIIAYMLTVLFIMIGGFMIITSSGNPEQITKGRKIVLYTIIAFTILIAARGVINLILMIIDAPTRI